MHEGLRRGGGAHTPRRRAVAPAETLAQGVHFFRDAPGIFEGDLAGLRQLDAALGANDQRLAQLFLKRFDLMAAGTLRQV